MSNKNTKPKRRLSIHGPTAPERRWIKLLAEWRGTGLEGSVFCRKRELSYATFRFWKKELPDRERRRQAKMSDSKPTIRFLPVQVRPMSGDQAASAKPIELVVAGHLIRIVSGFDPETLRRVLEILEGPGATGARTRPF